MVEAMIIDCHCHATAEIRAIAFEALLLHIADYAEEWLTSVEALGITLPQTRVAVRRNGRGLRAGAKEAEWEFEFG
jgi:hypothetical protein